MKRCNGCKKDLPLSSFYVNSQGKNGKRSKCIICDKEKFKQLNKKWREENPEKIKQSNKNWINNHPYKIKEYNYKNRSLRKGSSFANLTIKEWEQIKSFFDFICVYCGSKPNILTQDHIIPVSIGGPHTKQNIVPACQSCNSTKKDKMIHEFIRK